METQHDKWRDWGILCCRTWKDFSFSPLCYFSWQDAKKSYSLDISRLAMLLWISSNQLSEEGLSLLVFGVIGWWHWTCYQRREGTTRGGCCWVPWWLNGRGAFCPEPPVTSSVTLSKSLALWDLGLFNFKREKYSQGPVWLKDPPPPKKLWDL